MCGGEGTLYVSSIFTVLMILQAMDHEVLNEMEKVLGENKTLENLTLINELSDEILPKEFCRHILFGIGQNTSLSEAYLDFLPRNWDCPRDGRLVYVSHMLCDSVGCSV